MQSNNVFFINKEGLQVFDGNKVKPVFQPVKTDDQRKADFAAWAALKPVYFATWMWEVACKRQPDKYKMFLPVYQGMRVVLT